jgi:hypothetical protein
VEAEAVAQQAAPVPADGAPLPVTPARVIAGPGRASNALPDVPVVAEPGSPAQPNVNPSGTAAPEPV